MEEKMGNADNFFAKDAEYYQKIVDKHSHFIQYMQSLGYGFKFLDNLLFEDFDKKLIFLRYDIHMHDLEALPAIILSHIQNNVPGTFYINWDFTSQEKKGRYSFLPLQSFDTSIIRVGLHAAPVSTWLIKEKCDNDVGRAKEYIESQAFSDYILKIHAEMKKVGRKGPLVAEIIHGGERELDRISCSYWEHFWPETKFSEIRQLLNRSDGDSLDDETFPIKKGCTISGHGNFISSKVFQIVNGEKKLRPVRNLFEPRSFFEEKRIQSRGFKLQTTHFPDCRETNTKRMLFDGHPLFKGRIFARAKTERGMVFTFHPSRWGQHKFDDILAEMTG